jgi:hypothetical protein
VRMRVALAVPGLVPCNRLPRAIQCIITVMLMAYFARGLQRLGRRPATTTPLDTTIRRRMDAAAERSEELASAAR